MARPGLFSFCALVLLVSAAHATDLPQVKVEPLPLLAEVETGSRAIDQSVMFRIHSPQSTRHVDSNSNQDLTLVLDVSGSMRMDSKLEKAKAAISAIVNNLGSGDRLHLITYHSSAKVEFTGGSVDNRDYLLARIAELTPQSSTNLYAGLEKAEAVLRLQSDRSSTKRIFLFSDGLVNMGVTARPAILRKVEELREKGTTTAAFGIGADYDETLMSSIAEVGHSEFFFIQGQEDMEKVVRVATAGFRNLFATDAEFRITPMSIVSDLHVFGQQSIQGDRDRSIRIKLGDLLSEETRTVLVDIKLPSLGETVEYLSYEIEYIVVGESAPVKQRGSLSVRVVDVGASTATPNNAVLLFRQLQQMLSEEEEIEQQIKLGNIQVARGLEDELESNLHKNTIQACSKQDTQEEAYACSRSKVAWERTKRSQDTMRQARPEMISKAYSFKRSMNRKFAETYDEL
jgi:Mg-chelatase subunit ChlD